MTAEIKILPQLGLGSRGQLQVVVNVPYSAKDWFRSRLEWTRCEYRWDRQYKCWLVDLDSLDYVAERLDLEIPLVLLEIAK